MNNDVSIVSAHYLTRDESTTGHTKVHTNTTPSAQLYISQNDMSRNWSRVLITHLLFL